MLLAPELVPGVRTVIRSRFSRKAYLGYTALVVLTLAVFSSLLWGHLASDARAAFDRELLNGASFLRSRALPVLLGSEDPSFQESIEALGREAGARLTVIRIDGFVLADSDADPRRMENHRQRPEFLAALEHGVGRSTRRSQTVRLDTEYLALRVDRNGEPVGYVRVAVPMNSMRERLYRLGLKVLGAAGIALLASLAAGWWWVRRTTGPVLEASHYVREMADGSRQTRIPVDRDDELGRIGQSVNDLVERHREEMDAFLQDRSKLLAVLSSMVEGVVAVDLDERVVHINEVAARLLGVTVQGDGTGRHIWELTRTREISMLLTQCIREGVGVSTEATAIGPARDRMVELYASPLRDGDGVTAGAVVVLHDVTELRRLEAVRRDFLVNASHELKTPITAIRGMVETMIDDDAMPSEIRARFLGRIREQSDRLSALVADMLVLSRLETVAEEGERVRVHLDRVARESVRTLAPAAEAKGLLLEFDSPREGVLALGREQDLREVVDNLVDNAIKYTPNGGSIRVLVGRESGFAFVEVRDSGMGIAQQHHTRIFERFYRVDQARSRELGGTGLGLAIVKHIALSLGGGVTVRSAPGTGSTFRVRVPEPPPEEPGDG